ncbi:MAG: flagellar protein FlgN [Planctomycetota bacterium]
MKTQPSGDPRLRLSVEDLCNILERLRGLHEDLLTVLGEKEEALVEVHLDELEEIRDREERLIREVIEEEKERLLVTEELGDMLSHERPTEITVSEILPSVPGDLAAPLSDAREGLRDVALRLARQNSVNRALIEHSVGHVQVFVSKLVAAENGSSYDRQGSTNEGGGTLFMDRRG